MSGAEVGPLSQRALVSLSHIQPSSPPIGLLWKLVEAELWVEEAGGIAAVRQTEANDRRLLRNFPELTNLTGFDPGLHHVCYSDPVVHRHNLFNHLQASGVAVVVMVTDHELAHLFVAHHGAQETLSVFTEQTSIYQDEFLAGAVGHFLGDAGGLRVVLPRSQIILYFVK